MNCPHCGAVNASSRRYCTVCGGALLKVAAPPVAKRSRGKPAVTTWLLLGIVLSTLIVGIFAYNRPQGSIGLVMLALYMSLGIWPGIAWLRQVNRTRFDTPAALWLYRLVYVALALLAWPGLLLLLLLRSRVNANYAHPLKFAAISAAAVVLVPVLIVLLGRTLSSADQRRVQVQRMAQSQQIARLAETWGPALLRCDPLNATILPPGAERPAATSDGILLLDVTFPQVSVSEWQRELPVSQQATTRDDLVWLACLQHDKSASKCEYESGPSLDYTTVTMSVRLVYAGKEPFTVDARISGAAPDECPSAIHTVNGAIDYVVKADGSKAALTELHLDQDVSREATLARVDELIRSHSR